MATPGNFSELQHLLQLSYSENPEDQQKAAVDLSKLVEGAVFPAVSFGPISHALCRLVPSTNRTVASYSARALKLLVLDDALRSQAVVAGVPAVVCGAIRQWEDEVLCLRELLGALQTLTWDKACVKGVLQTDIVGHVIDFAQAPDQEVSVLSTAILANIFSYCDTLLLTDSVLLEVLAGSIPTLMEPLRPSSFDGKGQGPQKFYAIAALANASAHPRLADAIKGNGGLQLARDMERQSLANLNILGSRVVDCAQAMLYRLSDRREGEATAASKKFKFKW
eukprot:CAMPEP_0185017750 /NCGR_PEP_ID=MMETSP1103-20130426/660_1 /TAXON_ID=36769 /ORGANISM="Paraphysomonas bandaiensis, Strain Caron Lab Isolate" /LENGTH=279 /DNA_ID=CAMNT_0027547317 /DNA_START=179 /DNA_END=1015 /DNA_ORIENTATION=+